MSPITQSSPRFVFSPFRQGPSSFTILAQISSCHESMTADRQLIDFFSYVKLGSLQNKRHLRALRDFSGSDI